MSNPRWYSSRTLSLTVSGTIGNSFQKSWERIGVAVIEVILASIIVEAGRLGVLVGVNNTEDDCATGEDGASTSGVLGI